MFFPEKIISIKQKDRVLEIGPGGNPHPRADVFLDKEFKNDDEKAYQRGFAKELKTDKPTVYYQGGQFPFRDDEFDYVICSHVLEHIEDVDFFISEISRVAKKGYLEYPLIYYDYIYNFDVHLSFIKYFDNTIHWIPKNITQLDSFISVQSFFFKTLEMDYFTFVNDFKNYFFEGFEWEGIINSKRVNAISDVCHNKNIEIVFGKASDSKNKEKIDPISFKLKLKNKLKSIIDRI